MTTHRRRETDRGAASTLLELRGMSDANIRTADALLRGDIIATLTAREITATALLATAHVALARAHEDRAAAMIAEDHARTARTPR